MGESQTGSWGPVRKLGGSLTLLVEIKDLKGKDQREASVKEGADHLEGLVFTTSEGVMENSDLDMQGFSRGSWFDPREPALVVLLAL